VLEIVSSKLNLLYKFDSGYGRKYILDTMEELINRKFDGTSEEIQTLFFIEWAHADIANSMQGEIDDGTVKQYIKNWNDMIERMMER